ncbi:hypothetical protein Bbelb_098750 [Branchiostoma belcheri]|nr:hypothetical protein Bbelb_098750 [Branchiostoma belcheri]
MAGLSTTGDPYGKTTHRKEEINANGPTASYHMCRTKDPLWYNRWYSMVPCGKMTHRKEEINANGPYSSSKDRLWWGPLRYSSMEEISANGSKDRHPSQAEARCFRYRGVDNFNRR